MCNICILSKVLQFPKQELSTEIILLNTALINLQEYRSKYSSFFKISVEIAKKIMECTIT
jgi:hypothetical protein